MADSQRSPAPIVETTRLRTDTRHVLVAAGVFVLTLVLSIIIGNFGPLVQKRNQGVRSRKYFNVIDGDFDNMYRTEINSMIPEHQMVWLNCYIKRPESYDNKDKKHFQLVFEVSAWGMRGDKTHRLANNRIYAHTVTCLPNKRWCKPVPLWAQNVVLYPEYLVHAELVHAEDTFPDAVITTKMYIGFINREFTSFAMGWYYLCLAITLLVLFTPRLGFGYRLLQSPPNAWSIEQRWTLALLVGLVFLYDHPLLAGVIYSGHKNVATALAVVYIYSAFAFVGILLLHFLSLVHDLQFGRERHKQTVMRVGVSVVVCGAIAAFGATTNVFNRLRNAREPSFADFGMQHVLKTTQCALIFFVTVYIVWFAVEAAKALKLIVAMPHHGKLLFFLSVGTLGSMLTAIFVGAFDTAAQTPLVFVVFTVIPNLYVWTLAYLLSPLDVNKGAAPMLGGATDLQLML